MLLYGSGLRLREWLRLRVKKIEFSRHELVESCGAIARSMGFVSESQFEGASRGEVRETRMQWRASPPDMVPRIRSARARVFFRTSKCS